MPFFLLYYQFGSVDGGKVLKLQLNIDYKCLSWEVVFNQ